MKFGRHGPAPGLAAGALAALSAGPDARADAGDTTIVAAWHAPATTPPSHGGETPSPPDVGDSASALPGIIRVPVAGAVDRTGVGVASSAGFGWTESVLHQGDSHDRVFGSVAASVRPVRFFVAALELDGRYDWHTDPSGASGWTGEPRVTLRVGAPLGSGFHVGAQVGVWFPGGNAPSWVFGATTPDASVLASYRRGDSPLVVTSRAGFRWDNSAQSVPNAGLLSPSDRVALGINQASAVLVGLGAALRASARVELLADATWDLLVGSGAPAALQSPLVVSAGTRVTLDRQGTCQISFVGATSPSERPPFTMTAPLVDVEPRVSGFVAFTVRPAGPRPAPTMPAVASEPLPPPPPPLPPAPPPVARVIARGRIVSEADHAPVAHAHLALQTTGGAPREATTDDQGRFEVDDLDPGAASIDVTADGFTPVTRTLTLPAAPGKGADEGAGEGAGVEITLAKALPSGQVRGLVRDFSGKPIAAQIRVEPVGVDAQAAVDGTFEVNVAPGAYELVVHASGYVDQRRRVAVERDGVTMLNVELRKVR